MKQLVAFVLVLAILLSLCACGASDKDGNSPVVSMLSTNKTTTLEFGTAVETDFVEFTFQSAVVDYRIGGDNGHRPASEGMQFFCLVGTVRNTAGSELNITNVAGTMTFNDKYSYSVNGNAVYSENILYALPALVEGDFLIYAEVPYALLEQMVDCKVEFSFNRNFESKPEKMGEFRYEIYLDEAVCAKAAEGPVLEMQYFEECPILPNPLSFVAVRQSSRSSSSRNGKTTSIKYDYMMNYGAPDSIGEAFEKYKNALIEHGFAVKPGENGEDIFYGNQFLATVKIDSESMVFDLALGNEGLTDLDKAGKVEPENIYALGDVIKNDYVRLQLNKFATAKELRSGKSSTGYYFTYGSASGDPLFHLTGTFKNLGNARVDIRNTYITFTFDDQYTYPGKMTGVVKDTGFFVEDVSPLSDVTCYLYAEVPEKVIKNFKSCKVQIGFTRNFDYTTVDSAGTPLFKYCDDVSTLLIEQ